MLSILSRDSPGPAGQVFAYMLAQDSNGSATAAGSNTTRPRELEISITPPHRLPVDTDVVEAYADIGVTRLILLAPGESHEQQDELLEFVASTPRQLPDTGHRQQQMGRTFSRL